MNKTFKRACFLGLLTAISSFASAATFPASSTGAFSMGDRRAD